MSRHHKTHETPRWPWWVTSVVLLASLAALIGSVLFAISQRDDAVLGYAPIGDDRPPGLAMPDPIRSPGDVFPVGLDEICVPGYSSRVRNVSAATKERVYAEYGITHHEPGEYEMDHIVPLEIGGSNDPRNLYPEPAEPRPGFHEKDVLENTLHDLVCSHELDLGVAQQAIATDWYAAYLEYVLHR